MAQQVLYGPNLDLQQRFDAKADTDGVLLLNKLFEAYQAAWYLIIVSLIYHNHRHSEVHSLNYIAAGLETTIYLLQAAGCKVVKCKLTHDS